MKSGEAFGSFCGSEVILWWEETSSSGLSPWLWVPLLFPLIPYPRASWESVGWKPGWGSMPTLHSEEDWMLVRPRMVTLRLLISSPWFRIPAAARGLHMAQPCSHADPSHYHRGNVVFAYLCFAWWFIYSIDQWLFSRLNSATHCTLVSSLQIILTSVSAVQAGTLPSPHS